MRAVVSIIFDRVAMHEAPKSLIGKRHRKSPRNGVGCVTNNWAVQASTVADRPSPIFTCAIGCHLVPPRAQTGAFAGFSSNAAPDC